VAWLKSFAIVAALCCPGAILASPAESPADPENRLPAEALSALHAPDSVVLYALEPWDDGRPQLHGYKVLGKATLDGEQRAAALAEFETSVARWDGAVGACFDPHHALRVEHEGHTYDFLLCYLCQSMQVYRDGKEFAGVGATGSAEPLNALLRAKGLPLPHYYSDEARAAREAGQREREVRWKRWQQATPASIAALLEGNAAYAMGESYGLPDLAPALAVEIPDPRQRILALFAWYGSGAGPWSGFPAYEVVPQDLLMGYPTVELVAAAQSPGLTPAQLEGAARFFASWDFDRQRPGDIKSLPAELKSRLQQHVLDSGDKKRLDWAGRLFDK
jgi:hypothetical protein